MNISLQLLLLVLAPIIYHTALAVMKSGPTQSGWVTRFTQDKDYWFYVISQGYVLYFLYRGMQYADTPPLALGMQAVVTVMFGQKTWQSLLGLWLKLTMYRKIRKNRRWSTLPFRVKVKIFRRYMAGMPHYLVAFAPNALVLVYFLMIMFTGTWPGQPV